MKNVPGQWAEDCCVLAFSDAAQPACKWTTASLGMRCESLFLISVNQWLSCRDCTKHILEIFILSCEIKFLSRPPVPGESGDCGPDKSCNLSEVSRPHLSSSLHTFVISERLNGDRKHIDGSYSNALLKRQDNLVRGFILFCALRKRKN